MPGFFRFRNNGSRIVHFEQKIYNFSVDSGGLFMVF